MQMIRRSTYIYIPVLLLCLFFACGICRAQVATDSTAKDSLLLKQIEAAMGNTTEPVTPPAQTRSSLNFNPDIGVIGDFWGSYISKGQKNIALFRQPG